MKLGSGKVQELSLEIEESSLQQGKAAPAMLWFSPNMCNLENVKITKGSLYPLLFKM